MIIRLATPADLDAMTWVLVGASPLDPVYPYRFPNNHLYPGEFAALCRQKCAEYLSTSTVVVCEMPTNPDDDTTPTHVVAFSAWDIPASPFHPTPITTTKPLTSPSRPLQIGNLTRQQTFRTTLSHQKSLFFDTPLHSLGGHTHLKLLLTHPSYQRRGAGTALTRWGITQARLRGAHTTVFASPMGRGVYRRLGFVEVGRFRVQLEGEGEFVEIGAMVLGRGRGAGMREGEEGDVEGVMERGVRVSLNLKGVVESGMGMGRCGRRVGETVGVYEAAACA